MQLREDLQLQTVIRALTEVVMPAVDSGNALAVEQLQVVIGMLHLLAARLPLRFRYDCDELARLLELCKALDASEGSALARANVAGAAVLARAQADPVEVLQALHDDQRELEVSEHARPCSTVQPPIPFVEQPPTNPTPLLGRKPAQNLFPVPGWIETVRPQKLIPFPHPSAKNFLRHRVGGSPCDERDGPRLSPVRQAFPNDGMFLLAVEELQVIGSDLSHRGSTVAQSLRRLESFLDRG